MVLTCGRCGAAFEKAAADGSCPSCGRRLRAGSPSAAPHRTAASEVAGPPGDSRKPVFLLLIAAAAGVALIAFVVIFVARSGEEEKKPAAPETEVNVIFRAPSPEEKAAAPRKAAAAGPLEKFHPVGTVELPEFEDPSRSSRDSGVLGMQRKEAGVRIQEWVLEMPPGAFRAAKDHAQFQWKRGDWAGKVTVLQQLQEPELQLFSLPSFERSGDFAFKGANSRPDLASPQMLVFFGPWKDSVQPAVFLVPPGRQVRSVGLEDLRSTPDHRSRWEAGGTRVLRWGDTESGPRGTLRNLAAPEEKVRTYERRAFALSPSGRRVCTFDEQFRLVVQQADDGVPVVTGYAEAPDLGAIPFAYSPSERYLVASLSRRVYLFDLEAGRMAGSEMFQGQLLGAVFLSERRILLLARPQASVYDIVPER